MEEKRADRQLKNKKKERRHAASSQRRYEDTHIIVCGHMYSSMGEFSLVA